MQKAIRIYDLSGSMVAEIMQTIDSSLTDRLDGTLTLSFTSKLKYAPEITAESTVEFDGQYYRVTQTQSSASGGAFLLTVSCEQESISLVDYEIGEFNFTGTADDALARLLDGTGITATAEHTGTITISAQGGNRRSVLLEIVKLCEGEIEYHGHEIRIVNRRGDTEPIDIVQVCQCTDCTKTWNLRDGSEGYELSGMTAEGYAVGDEVLVDFAPLGIHVQKRIVGISYNPFNCTGVSVEIGDYITDITEDYAQLEKIFLLKTDASIEFKKFIDSAEGKTGLEAALSGSFVSADVLKKYTTTAELEATVAGYIKPGEASLTSALNGQYVSSDQLKNYVKTTELSTAITQEIKDGNAKLTLSAQESTVEENVPTDEIAGAYENYIPEYIGEYPFEFTDGYFTSTNKGTDSSFAIGIIEFSYDKETVVALECINYAEERCDYGMIGNIDVALDKSNTADSTDKLFYSFYGESSPDVVTLYLTVPAGNHRVEVKFIKDGSYSSHDDCFKIRAVAAETKTTSSKSTITLTAGGTEISSADITFTGFVTFESLSTPGATTIDGGNINTDNLIVKQVYFDDNANSQPILSSSLEDGVGDIFIGFVEFLKNPANPHNIMLFAKRIYLMQPGGTESSTNSLMFDMDTRRIVANDTWNFDKLYQG